jgi:hypothetical protein
VDPTRRHGLSPGPVPRDDPPRALALRSLRHRPDRSGTRHQVARHRRSERAGESRELRGPAARGRRRPARIPARRRGAAADRFGGGAALVCGSGRALVCPRGRGADRKRAAVTRRRPGSADPRVRWFRPADGVRTARRHRPADVRRAGRGHEPVGTGRLRAGRAGADRRRVAGTPQGRRAVPTVHYGLPGDGAMVSAGSTECASGAADGGHGSAATAGCRSTVDDWSRDRRASRAHAARATAGGGSPTRVDARRRQIRPGVERAGDRRRRRDPCPSSADSRRRGAGHGRKRSVGPDERAEQLR